MAQRMWRLRALVCGLLALVVIVGCNEPERREVKMREETRASDPQPVPPGEMIVE